MNLENVNTWNYQNYKGSEILLKKIIYLCGILLTVGIFVVCSDYLRYAYYGVDFDVSEGQDGSVVFLFGYKNVDALYSIGIWERDSQSPLWQINFKYFLDEKLKYGEIPYDYWDAERNHHEAKQIYPQNNLAVKPMQPGREYCVSIHYSFNSSTGRASTDMFYVFTIGPDGFVKKIEPELLKGPI